jgi:ubiquinone/menaquinone biosynthesis C-methylase UbiE
VTGYEYRGLKAEAWDLLRGDTSVWPDRAFYLAIIRKSGEPVLDVGCGTGRLLLDYMQQGVEIDGIDNSPEMLTLCREKAAALGLSPDLREQSMESLELPRRYRTIMVPSSSLQLVTDLIDAKQAMARLVAHLDRGGTLVASFMKMRRAGQPNSFGWIPFGKAQRSDGATIRRFLRSDFDPQTQLERSEERFEVITDGTIVAQEISTSTVREYTLDQSLDLYRDAGLTDVRATSEFTHDPTTTGDHVWCVAGVKR